MECDVADLHSVESIADRVERTLGRLDVLVNNAASAAVPVPCINFPPTSGTPS